MRRFLSRLLQGALALLAVLVASFYLMKAASGSPWASERALSAQAQMALEAKYGLELGPWLGRVVRHADFGASWKHPDLEVRDILVQALPVSLELGGWALLVALGLGIPAALLCARWPGGKLDGLLRNGVLLGVVVPGFVLAPLAQEWIGLPLGTVAGWEGPWSRVLPALCAGLGTLALAMRLLRTSLLEELSRDHVRTARAKGLSPTRVLLRHAFPAALGPLLQALVPAVAGLLTGSLVIEQVFQVPGLGRHFVQSALQRDFPLALGVLCTYAFLLFLLGALADLSLWLLDPRTREARR